MKNNVINDFYLLSELCEDDLLIVATLINMMVIIPSEKIKNDLVSLKPNRYENEINLILDTLTIKSIKNLSKLLKHSLPYQKKQNIIESEINEKINPATI